MSINMYVSHLILETIKHSGINLTNSIHKCVESESCIVPSSLGITGENAAIGADCQKRSQSGLCSKRPDLHLVGDIALFPKVNVNKSKSTFHLQRVRPFDVYFHFLPSSMFSAGQWCYCSNDN